ncbi:hypothetical protein ACYEXS_25625 [Paenibacillus sp. MAH-36]|uniref:NIPSNAP domain-containing protein n=1 Tax=Paenibacillus violae TaxID=3077234 RepID=A0ABU3RG79_9BACL|nr:hypothetical protein [Paenibacillus sp. PFR10]MDU0203034.1 hypothetical protein [Paenibacillus sp. PFR10]
MSKVFVEYAINPEYRDSFLIYMQEWQKREGRLEVLEGTDQPGLYVEIWSEVSRDEYIAMKEDRLQQGGGRGNQAAWEKWVKGGLSKLHMWHFSPVN